jgi:hypothetical protein
VLADVVARCPNYAPFECLRPISGKSNMNKIIEKTYYIYGVVENSEELKLPCQSSLFVRLISASPGFYPLKTNLL